MKTITANQRLQLIGLLTLAEKHSKALEDIKASASEITGEALDACGHTSDAIYDDGSRDADTLLKKLDITVEG